MNLDEVNNILNTSSPEDWIVNDEEGVFTYKHDLNLHIQRADHESYRGFNEPWATSHPDSHAVSVDYQVKYGSSLVDKRTLVSVDGHRATLPMPKSQQDLRVRSDEVNFARIVNMGDRLDEYLRRSGLQVVSDNA
jgi:hypothetical protein